jgi:hypothetical protein
MIRKFGIAAIVGFGLVGSTLGSVAEARGLFGNGRQVTPQSYARTNYPGTSHYPGSSKDWAHLPYYMRADRRALGLFP